MLKINVKVPEDRGQTALVEIHSGLSRIARGHGVATAFAELASRHGNTRCDPLRPWGHPPFGRYQLLAQGPVPDGCDIEYGSHLLVFQPMSGQALEAEAFGRLLLPAYAGPAGKGNLLRPTQGGLRLDQKTFDALLGALADDPEALLSIDLLQAPAWWRFWTRPAPTLPIWTDKPRLSIPPLDEVSLATQIASGKRLARNTPSRNDDRIDSGRDAGRTSSSSSAVTDYAGKGGTFGGGGASGRWENAPSGGPGVDSAGRIVTGVAGAALVAGAIEAAGRDDSAKIGSESSGNDTGVLTGTNY